MERDAPATSALIACHERPLARSLAQALRAVWPALRVMAHVQPAALDKAVDLLNPSLIFLVCDTSSRWPAAARRAPALWVVLSARPNDAVRAFEVGAVDFVPLPWTLDRLRRCAARVQGRIDDRVRIDRLRWIAASSGRHTLLLAIDDIVCLVADHKYTRVVTINAEGLTRQSLTRLESSLDTTRFLRASRQAIVALDHVHRIERHDGCFTVDLRHPMGTVSVSRAYQPRWRQWLRVNACG